MDENKFTDRQLKILKAVMDGFIKEMQSVASSQIVEMYDDINACAATIRNEMVRLARMGLLMKSHISSGRIPTDEGIKFYLQYLLEEDKVPIWVQEKIQSRISANSNNIYEMLQIAIDTLASMTSEPVMGLLDTVRFYSNFTNLSKYPEFSEVSQWKSMLQFISDVNHLNSLLSDVKPNELFIIIGRDLKYGNLDEAAIIGRIFDAKSLGFGIIAVVSSKRLNYAKVIPLVRTTVTVIDRLLNKFI